MLSQHSEDKQKTYKVDESIVMFSSEGSEKLKKAKKQKGKQNVPNQTKMNRVLYS